MIIYSLCSWFVIRNKIAHRNSILFSPSNLLTVTIHLRTSAHGEVLVCLMTLALTISLLCCHTTCNSRSWKRQILVAKKIDDNNRLMIIVTDTINLLYWTGTIIDKVGIEAKWKSVVNDDYYQSLLVHYNTNTVM